MKFEELKRGAILIKEYHLDFFIIIRKTSTNRVDFISIQLDPLRIEKDYTDPEDWDYSYKGFKLANQTQIKDFYFNTIREIFE
jgi:hypothetical protein